MKNIYLVIDMDADPYYSRVCRVFSTLKGAYKYINAQKQKQEEGLRRCSVKEYRRNYYGTDSAAYRIQKKEVEP